MEAQRSTDSASAVQTNLRRATFPDRASPTFEENLSGDGKDQQDYGEDAFRDR